MNARIFITPWSQIDPRLSSVVSGLSSRGPQDHVGQLPRVIWPSDVDREKARLDSFFRGMDAAARACRSIARAPDKTADDAVRLSRLLDTWNVFYLQWRAFADTRTPLFGSANQWDLSQQYAKDLEHWQAAIAAACGPTGVPTVLPTDEPTKKNEFVEAWTPIVKWGAIALLAAGATYGLVQYSKTKGWL
jgi:hypothetical protein